MKIFQALAQIEFVLKMFAAAGFANFAAAFAAKNENALKEFIAAQSSAAAVEKIVEKLVEPTDEQITGLVTAELREHIVAAGFTLAADADPIAALKSGLAAHQSLNSQLSALNSGLGKAGIVVKAADEKKGVQESDITAAVAAKLATHEAHIQARLGTAPVPADVVSARAAGGPKIDPSLTGLARAIAANRLLHGATV